MSKVKEDDVFKFGQAQTGWGYGRVLIADLQIYVEVLMPAYSSTPDQKEWENQSRLLAGWTFDARICSDQWEIIDNVKASSPVVFPFYKVESRGKIWITDVSGKLLREASDSEASTLDFKFTTAPIRFENAFWGFHTNKWSKSFDRISLI
tara:strand:- start:87 stop:536 length:450 start_codon:yes stop_codon:yes gene_type:complete